jgi:hypothetical protein
MPQDARRRQGTLRVVLFAASALGSPPVTAARRLGRCIARAGCAATGSVELYQPSLPYRMPNKQPSFSERCRQMRDAAEQLLEISAFVNDEAVRMAAAQERFSERRGPKTERRAR